MTILALSGVRRSYGRTEALLGVDLVVEQPQVIGLLGRNGAGKSTLLRLIPPLIHAHAGEVRVFGLDPWTHQEEVKRRLGYLGDDDMAPPMLRGQDLLDLCAALQPRWDATLVRRFVDRFALDLRKPMTALSKGQRRQLGLLAAIGHRPELLILDEPAGNLDPVVRRELLGAVIELLADTGSTVLLATHLLRDIERLADRVVILHQGRVLVDETLSALRERTCTVEFAADMQASERLATTATCLASAWVTGKVRAVLRCAPAQARATLASALGSALPDVDAQGLALEDLFVQLTGGAS